MEKHYIQAQQLLEDSFSLAWQVFESGYRPNYIVGVWRGGAPIGIAVQEFLDVLGIESFNDTTPTERCINDAATTEIYM